MEIRGKLALVTGGSDGIGREIALQLQGSGADVIVTGRSSDKLQAMAGLGVAIAPQQLVADDLTAGRLLAPWGFTATGGRLALWVPGRRGDRRAERLAQWLGRELGG